MGQLAVKRSIPALKIPDPPDPIMLDKPCKHCPSAHYPLDPEATQLALEPFEIRLQAAFACGWNISRYCKGYCDNNGITNEDLKKVRWE